MKNEVEKQLITRDQMIHEVNKKIKDINGKQDQVDKELISIQEQIDSLKRIMNEKDQRVEQLFEADENLENMVKDQNNALKDC